MNDYITADIKCYKKYLSTHPACRVGLTGIATILKTTLRCEVRLFNRNNLDD